MADFGRIEIQKTMKNNGSFTLSATHIGGDTIQISSSFFDKIDKNFASINGNDIKIGDYNLKKLSSHNGGIWAEVLR